MLPPLPFSQTLRVAVIGDCGFVLVRRGELVVVSERQEHGFNEPYQIGLNMGDDPHCALVSGTPQRQGGAAAEIVLSVCVIVLQVVEDDDFRSRSLKY